jgi:hypothetical protein
MTWWTYLLAYLSPSLVAFAFVAVCWWRRTPPGCGPQ